MSFSPVAPAFGIDLVDCAARASAIGYFTGVEGIESAAIAMDLGVQNPPQAFVSIANEQALPNKIIGNPRQRVFVTLSVLFAENAARMDGDAPNQVDRVKRAVVAQFVGWTPQGAGHRLEYFSFNLRAIVDGVIWSECLFKTSYLLALP